MDLLGGIVEVGASVPRLKELALAQDPQDQVFSMKEISLPQRDTGQGIRDKEGDRGRRQGRRGRNNRAGTGTFVPQRQRTASDEEETDVARGKMAVHEGKRGNPHVRMKCLILTVHVN